MERYYMLIYPKIYCRQNVNILQIVHFGGECSSVIEHFSRMCEAWGSISSAGKNPPKKPTKTTKNSL
jgi:hypothetical protein